MDLKNYHHYQQTWLCKLMGFDFSVEYKKGVENVVVDALSRCHEVKQLTNALFVFSQVILYWLKAIKEELETDNSLQESKAKIQQNEAVGPWKLVKGIILFKYQIYFLENSKLVHHIIQEFHGSTHKGFAKTCQQIRANFYWKGMRKKIKEFIRNCDVCQQQKSQQTKLVGLLQPLPIPQQIWEDISVDFVEGLPTSSGKSTIFVVDRLPKYTHFIPLSHPFMVVGVARIFFEHVFKLHGFPRSIV